MVATAPDTVGGGAGGTEGGFQSRRFGSKMVACRGDRCWHEYFRHLCRCYGFRMPHCGCDLQKLRSCKCRLAAKLKFKLLAEPQRRG